MKNLLYSVPVICVLIGFNLGAAVYGSNKVGFSAALILCLACLVSAILHNRKMK
jgi:hypothetical protein